MRAILTPYRFTAKKATATDPPAKIWAYAPEHRATAEAEARQFRQVGKKTRVKKAEVRAFGVACEVVLLAVYD